MKNIKLLIVTLFFSMFLLGCGMKGPLYKAQATQSENKENVSVDKDIQGVVKTESQQADSSSI